MLFPYALLSGASASEVAEHLSASQVRTAIGAAPPGQIDLSGKDMSGEDLSGLDLYGAKLVRANFSKTNLHGVELVGADLTEANLTNADRTFSWFIRTNFTRANPARRDTEDDNHHCRGNEQYAKSRSDLRRSGFDITVHFSFYDMRGANFSRAEATPRKLQGSRSQLYRFHRRLI